MLIQINSEINFPVLHSIFFKNSPYMMEPLLLETIESWLKMYFTCKHEDDFPGELGMRHRAFK